MDEHEARYLEKIIGFAQDFLAKVQLVGTLRTFRADPGPEVEDAIMAEVRADADLLAECLCDWLGFRIEWRKAK